MARAARGASSAAWRRSSATVASSDFHGLRTLKALAPERFQLGVLLYTGDSVVPFGEDLFAVPFGHLWRPRSQGS